MKMRYRKPSVKTVLGVTKLKKRVKKALGINKLLWPFRAVNNYQRGILRRAGYYSPELKALRAAKQGKVAGPIGALHLGEGEHESGGKGLDASALLLASALGGEHDKKGEGPNPLLLGALLAGDALGGEGSKGHKKGDGPNLGEALLLSTALKGTEKGSEEAHTPKAKPAAAHKPQAKQAAAQEKSGAAHPHAPRAKGKKAEEQPAPKRHRGFRLFGLLLVALLVASGIVAVWYYWVI
jgi:hypothetical protein